MVLLAVIWMYRMPKTNVQKLLAKQKTLASIKKSIQKPLYTIREHLGSGGYGRVYRGTWNRQSVAIKIGYSNVTYKRLGGLRAEYELVKAIDSPHVVKAYAYCDRPEPAFIMSYAPIGTLGDWMSENDVAWPKQGFTWTLGLLKGIKAIHDKNYIHSDLHANNILVYSDRIIRISDLGCAYQSEYFERDLHEFVGLLLKFLGRNAGYGDSCRKKNSSRIYSALYDCSFFRDSPRRLQDYAMSIRAKIPGKEEEPKMIETIESIQKVSPPA